MRHVQLTTTAQPGTPRHLRDWLLANPERTFNSRFSNGRGCVIDQYAEDGYGSMSLTPLNVKFIHAWDTSGRVLHGASGSHIYRPCSEALAVLYELYPDLDDDETPTPPSAPVVHETVHAVYDNTPSILDDVDVIPTVTTFDAAAWQAAMQDSFASMTTPKVKLAIELTHDEIAYAVKLIKEEVDEGELALVPG